jgi:hypothetical protein
MNDKTIRDAIHGLHDDYQALTSLLTCYEAWGGGPADDADCDRFLGERTGEDQ